MKLLEQILLARWYKEDPEVIKSLKNVLHRYPTIDLLPELQHTISESERLRLSGNDQFTRENYSTAVDHYSAALKLVEPTLNSKLKGILYANRAAARMAQRRYVS